MSDIDWGKIIAFILRLIADGLDKNEAISKAASHFGLSASAIKTGVSGKI